MMTAPRCSCIYLPFGQNKGLETADLGSEYQKVVRVVSPLIHHLPPNSNLIGPEFRPDL